MHENSWRETEWADGLVAITWTANPASERYRFERLVLKYDPFQFVD